ncbi:hypothetical protein R3P38DRAFT_3311666 [Favolaschia claudopus]|uniref:Uncharacterized protein n=1 Tax=Favolaschia claudopus TaxID=2862362 RepID=A0AAW0CF80_9AGAR
MAKRTATKIIVFRNPLGYWKVPQTLSAWIQRGDRAARRPGMLGLAVLLAEKAAFEAEVEVGGVPQRRDYAILHGQKRGSFKGSVDAVPPRDEHVIADNTPREGIYILIQATICRRLILRQIFQNPVHNVPAAQCCDICNPKLFDQVRPGKLVRASRQKGIRKGPPVDSVRDALFLWRRNILKTKYPGRYFAANAILDDATCELLASVSPIDAIETPEQLLASSWSRWEDLRRQLFVLKGLDIPALPPPPPRQKRSPPNAGNSRNRSSTSRDLSAAEAPPPATRVSLNA